MDTSKNKKIDFFCLYSPNIPVKELCEKFGICKSTAYNWIREYSPIRKPLKGRIITPSDYRRLERENQTLRTENAIFHQCGVLDEIPLEDKLAMIDRLCADFSVHILCKTLGVRKSTYYHRKLRSPVKKWYELDDEILRPLIKQIFVNSQERFGAHKIKFVLKQQGHIASKAHIARLMKEMDLVCKQVRLRYTSTTNRKYKYYRNKVQRKFDTEAPNRIWVSDITHAYVKDVLCSIGAIIDLYARKIIAFDVVEKVSVKFMIDLFDSAFKNRQHPVNVMHRPLLALIGQYTEEIQCFFVCFFWGLCFYCYTTGAIPVFFNFGF